MRGKDLIAATLFGGAGGSSGGGSGGDDSGTTGIDALITRAITEVNSDAERVGTSAFYECKALTTANLPKAKSIGSKAFASCAKLTTASMPEATYIADDSFSWCTSLTTVNMAKVEGIGGGAFTRDAVLKMVHAPAVTTIGSRAFDYCGILKAHFPLLVSVSTQSFYCAVDMRTADLPKANAIGSSAFHECGSLTSLILRGETLCTLGNTNAFKNCHRMLGTTNTTYNPDGLHDGYVYVPRSLIEDYPAATNWSALTLQYRALEDYTVDGTITGELEESKI